MDVFITPEIAKNVNDYMHEVVEELRIDAEMKFEGLEMHLLDDHEEVGSALYKCESFVEKHDKMFMFSYAQERNYRVEEDNEMYVALLDLFTEEVMDAYERSEMQSEMLCNIR